MRLNQGAIIHWFLLRLEQNLWVSILSVWTWYSRGEAEHLAWTGVGTLHVEWEWLAAQADWSQKVRPEEGHIVGYFSLPRTMTATGRANDTVLVVIGRASEEAMEMECRRVRGGDERGQKGTLCPGEDWRMWGFGPGREQLMSWDWVGGLEGTGLRWAGLALSDSHTHTQKHTYTHTPPLAGTPPSHSVAVMPLNSRLHHTHSEQPWSPSNHQQPPSPWQLHKIRNVIRTTWKSGW